MENHQNKINQLLEKLSSLADKQVQFQQEINQVKQELLSLKTTSSLRTQEIDLVREAPRPEIETTTIPETVEKGSPAYRQTTFEPLKPRKPASPLVSPEFKADFERFLGENLINKIGIMITVLGVGIGAKYAIDNQMISPLTRIILGYLLGIGLLGFAIKLKTQYVNFSAVLLSGAIAIMYFITYAAYDFYALLPQPLAFALMVIFTGFTVVAAIHYNTQVIAHIGLVGAYAVPFLLREGDGKVAILFSYMTIINSGILILAFKKYWKLLNYVAFGFTWLIYSFWYITNYYREDHFTLAFVFLFLFFALFYSTFLAYKFIKAERFEVGDVFLLLVNSFIFYGIGYKLLETHPVGGELLGLFTLLNAVIHFMVTVILFKKKLADRNLFYLMAGLVLIFITIAVPVQLDGNWVTLFWVGQTLLLFWIGRTKKVAIYETLSYPMMVLAFFSLIQDWNIYEIYSVQYFDTFSPLLNINFLTSLLFIAAFSGIQYLHHRNSYCSELKIRERLEPFIGYLVPGILLLVSYFAFRMEIAAYWDQLYLASAIENAVNDYGNEYTQYDYHLIGFKKIWIINYSLIFITLLIWGNIKKIRSKALGSVTLGLSVFAALAFLTMGLFIAGELRTSYLTQSLSEFYHRGLFSLLIRYVSLACFAFMLFSFSKLVRQEFMELSLDKAFDCFIHCSIIWVASSELIAWMDILGYGNSYKLGMSILWGLYALSLIGMGIRQKKKHLRLGAMGLFGFTLIKVFFYDVAHLDTISKTIVLVSLGILLLIISFLYNKYKDLISDDTKL